MNEQEASAVIGTERILPVVHVGNSKSASFPGFNLTLNEFVCVDVPEYPEKLQVGQITAIDSAEITIN